MERIVVSDLRASTRVGVTEQERRHTQEVRLTLELTPSAPYSMSDRLEDTIDYSAVRSDVLELARSAGCALIETLAGRVADLLIDTYPLDQAVVTVRKFPYPDTRYVAYTCSRSRSDSRPLP